MGWIKSIIFMVVFAYLLKFFYFFLVGNGIGVHHNNVHPGTCRVIPGISCGSEQISVTLDGLAFITNGYRGMTRCNPEFVKGHLYFFDFNKPDNNVTELKIVSEKLDLDSFEPHGMDIYEFPEEGFTYLYVINHANEVESVEVFVYDRKKPNEIVHTRTITDEKFVCINDIAVVDNDHFYVTNFHKYCKTAKIMMLVEFFLKMQTANIVYYDHGNTAIAAEGSFFNGITLSKSKNEVVVIHGGSKDVYIFDRDQENVRLKFKKNVFLGYAGDNIFLDKQAGNFYIAYFKTFGLLDVSRNKSDFCSSSGAMLSVESENIDNVYVKEIFHDNGEKFLCGSSSLVHYKGQFLIGTVFDKLGYCRKE